jgi:hypothetical protein
MTNKHLMIFQTAVRKYVNMHEKVKVAMREKSRKKSNFK